MSNRKNITVIVSLSIFMLFFSACSSEIENMVEVTNGSFIMGNTRGDKTYLDEENTLHEIELTYDYYMGKYEITNAQYIEFLNSVGADYEGRVNGHTLATVGNYSKIDYVLGEFVLKERSGNYLNDEGYSEYPVNKVTWWGAIEYCNWLSRKENLKEAYDIKGNLLDETGSITDDITKVKGYRLPTEAEWEYAARGGQNSIEDYKYAGSNDINEVGWCKGNTDNIQKCGLKKPNELGIYDMSGNLCEWCHDNKRVYPDWKLTNPIGPSSSPYKVLRGGYFSASEEDLRISYRLRTEPYDEDYDIGFRIARTK